MDSQIYSTYEAKARLSEILQKVRNGQVVVVTHRGTPVAEIRPISSSGSGLDRRLKHLADRGVLRRAEDQLGIATVSRRPGALGRFLEERD